MKTAHKILGLFLAFALALASGEPTAQGYPNKPMRMVIPFSPGGGNDLVGRIIAAKMPEGLGQPVIVENRPGADGAIAARNVANAAPDGLSILIGPSGTMTINPAIYSKLPYETLRDFLPVTMIGTYSLILAVNPSLPVRTTRELIEYAKARPTQVNYGSTSGLFQLASELFNQQAGTKFVRIPYKGNGDVLTAVISGEITMELGGPELAGALKAGKVRGLAITRPTRDPAWPDLPTMAEAGFPGMEIVVWVGMFVPMGTPTPIVQRLHQEVVRVLALPDIRERFASLGFAPSGISPEDFARRVAQDIARWTKVAKEANIKAD